MTEFCYSVIAVLRGLPFPIQVAVLLFALTFVGRIADDLRRAM